MTKGAAGWQYRPFIPESRAEERAKPAICRLAPFETGVEVEVLGEAGALYIREKDTQEPWRAIEMIGSTAIIDGLLPDTDYELRAKGRLRYVRTGFNPDRVVNYLHPQDEAYAFSGRYLCSPTLVRAPSGALIAGMDVFEGGGPQNLTLLFRSDDNGKTWRYLCDLFPAYWGALFTHRARCTCWARARKTATSSSGRHTTRAAPGPGPPCCSRAGAGAAAAGGSASRCPSSFRAA